MAHTLFTQKATTTAKIKAPARLRPFRRMIAAFTGLGLLIPLLAHSSPNDVYGEGIFFVKVTEDASKTRVGFQICSKINPMKCKGIGKKNLYLKSDLEDLRASEKLDVIGASVLDAAIIFASFGVGTWVGFVAGGSTLSSSAALVTLPVGGILGAAAGSRLASWIDRLNPVEQYNQLETLDQDILNDKTVFISSDIITFSRRLEEVLENL